MATLLPPLPKTFIITMDRADPNMAALMDLSVCRRCSHDLEEHGPEGAVPPSKSRCQLAGCDCARFELPAKEG